MHHTIDYLLKNNSQIVKYYLEVKKHWEEIFLKAEASDEDSLAKILHLEQWKFEMKCDQHASLAKELMAIVGQTQFSHIIN